MITLAETSVLFRFTDRLYRAKQLNEVYEAALDAIIEALGCDRASVLLFDSAGAMRFVAWRGLSESYRRAVDGHSPWKQGDRDSSPIFVPDLEGAELPPSLKSVIAAEGIGALAFIPIMVDRLTVGKFMAYYGAPHDLSEAERNVAVTIARQLGFSLERERAEEQRSLLMQELNHRVKNTLATVQALALQTFGAHQRIEDATAIFQARLIALANAHDVLTQQNWSGADLPDIVHRIVEPFRLTSSRIAIEGPTVWLSPRQALAIGMALHELATNASKYGALSSDKGGVNLSWTISAGAGGQVHIIWTEAGGPTVSAPTRQGFGSRLIEKHLADELGGSVTVKYEATGVIAEILLPRVAL